MPFVAAKYGNMSGRRKSSRFYGVSKHKNGYGGLGTLGFNTEEEAARAVNDFIIDQRLPRSLNVIPQNDEQ